MNADDLSDIEKVGKLITFTIVSFISMPLLKINQYQL